MTKKPKPGYKQVKWFYGKEIEIPEEWEIKLLKEICKVRQGLQIPISERFIESGPNRLQYITVKSIHSNNFQEFIENAGKRVICTEDDILFTRTGNTGEIITNIRGVFHNNFFLIDFNRNLMIKDYLVYFLKQNKIQSIIRSLSGSTTIPDLNHGDFYRLLITFPSKSEQQKIASILSNIDSLIESYDRIIIQTKRLKTGLMQQLLTKGIHHKKFKKVKWMFGKDIEIPEEWYFVKMNKICKKISVGIATSTTKYFVEKGIPLLRNQNIKSGYIDTSNLLYISEEFAKMNDSKKLLEGDIVSMRTGYPGQSAVVPAEMEGWQTFTTLIIRPNSDLLNSEYLTIFLNSFGRKQITSSQAGAAQQNLNVGWVSNLWILLPSKLSEQQKIASILNNVDEKISELESKKKSIEYLKKGLMQKLLTGKIRVKI